MHTSNTLYPSDVCSLSLFLSFNMDYFIFEKKTKRKTTTIDVWSISKVNYRRRRHRIKRERE